MTRARDVADKNLAVISAGNNGQILTSDGTNWSAQNAPTEVPAHGANGNVLTSDGSQWTSAAPATVDTDLVNDTSPQLGGDLDMQSHSISNGVLGVKNTGTQSELRLYCEVGNAHYVGLKAPAHSAFSGNHSITMPPNTGNNGEFLKTDGNGVTSWAAAGGGSWDLLSTSTVTNGAAQVDFNGSAAGFDNNVYGQYCIIFPYWQQGASIGSAQCAWLYTSGGSVAKATRHKFAMAQFWNSYAQAHDSNASFMKIGSGDGTTLSGRIFFTLEDPPYISTGNSAPSGTDGPRMTAEVAFDNNYNGLYNNRTMITVTAGNMYDATQAPLVTGFRLWGEYDQIKRAKFYLYGIKK